MTPSISVFPLEELLSSVVAAFNAADSAALAKSYTEDAVLMPAGVPIAVGREAIQSFNQRLFDQSAARQSITTEECVVLGDWAFARGTFTAEISPKAAGEGQALSGKWVNLFALQPDGAWKIARHIWNV